jgi:hypothetical protein
MTTGTRWQMRPMGDLEELNEHLLEELVLEDKLQLHLE